MTKEIRISNDEKADRQLAMSDFDIRHSIAIPHLDFVIDFCSHAD
jgi:hypothetical protein